jgi:hypothetical protein
MMIQLNPTVPLWTPKGAGFAHFVIDMGQEHHLMWVVFIDETGECWTFANPEVRIQYNISMGRPKPNGPEIQRPSKGTGRQG